MLHRFLRLRLGCARGGGDLGLSHGSTSYAGSGTRPAPVGRGACLRVMSGSVSIRQGHTATAPDSTPWQSSSTEIQPASPTTSRLSAVIGIGVRRIEVIWLPPGESK